MEWGAGMRIAGSTVFPRAMAIGATGRPDLAYRMGRVAAEEARAIGVHVNFAPVADINNNPANPVINVRSFGSTPDLVGEMASAFANGVHDGGVLAVAKHFPGHGDTATDSHIDLPVLPFSRERLDSLELKPFQTLIEQDIDGIMVAHVALPKIDSSRVPATLSPALINGILRTDLGFNGLVVSDAMRMHGVTKHFGSGEAAVRALEAGIDMLIMPDDLVAARRAVLAALRSGRLPQARLDTAVKRVLAAKYDAGLAAYKPADLDHIRQHVARPEHGAVSREIARRAVTLLVNEDSLLPITDIDPSILLLALGDSDDPDEGRYLLRRLEDAMPHARIERRLLDRRSHSDEFERALEQANRYDLVVAASFLRVRTGSGSIALPDQQAKLLKGLADRKTPLAVVSFGSPYAILALDGVDAYLTTYGAGLAAQQAAAEALAGQINVTGTLPVDIPGLYDQGFGLAVSQEMLRWGVPLDVYMDPRLEAQVDALIETAIGDSAFPGAAVAIGHDGAGVLGKGYGYYTYESEESVTPSSLFDLASLTKVIATTPAVMLLVDRNAVDLDAPVAVYLPEFAASGKDAVTVRHLLTHTGGLAAFYAFYSKGITDRQGVIDFIMHDSLRYAPGSSYVYSDLGMITLGLMVERITGKSLGDFLEEELWHPLGMLNTGFRPVRGTVTDVTVVPTEIDSVFRMRLVQGEVHDENAWILGGEAGHAGLFSTLKDLARYAYMISNAGRANGRQFFREETLRRFTTRAENDLGHTRALGWDTKSETGYSSAGQFFGPRSFGHTGFTGTSIWIDPDADLFVILLTNRVYPTRKNQKISDVRSALANIAAKALPQN
jgi:beta-glucosidase-like glycosyl hydrolase/CubicO group peptidase (beta-lactamase class C family)